MPDPRAFLRNQRQHEREMAAVADIVAPRCPERNLLYGAQCTQPLVDGAHAGMHIGTTTVGGKNEPIQWPQLDDEGLIA